MTDVTLPLDAAAAGDPKAAAESDTTLVECIVRIMNLTTSGSWPWLGDLRAAGERRGVNFVQIVTFFEAYPQHLENFLGECSADRAELAIQDVLDAIGVPVPAKG
jgi:hypothetical protein